VSGNVGRGFGEAGSSLARIDDEGALDRAVRRKDAASGGIRPSKHRKGFRTRH
jgi:hypothetical protein